MNSQVDIARVARGAQDIGGTGNWRRVVPSTQLTAARCHCARQGARCHRSEREAQLTVALAEVPGRASEILHHNDRIAAIARDVSEARDVLYLGRGTSYPIALEGALKLKEISYIHAEAYAAGEMKHGPITLIDEDVPVIVIAPGGDPLFDKTAGVQGRGPGRQSNLPLRRSGYR